MSSERENVRLLLLLPSRGGGVRMDCEIAEITGAGTLAQVENLHYSCTFLYLPSPAETPPPKYGSHRIRATKNFDKINKPIVDVITIYRLLICRCNERKKIQQNVINI